MSDGVDRKAQGDRTAGESAQISALEQARLHEEERRRRNKALSPPAPLLWGAFFLLALAIGMAAVYRYVLPQEDPYADLTPVYSQDVYFMPADQETLHVRLSPEAESVVVLEGPLAKHLLGVTTAMNRQRVVLGMQQTPSHYRLTEWDDGRLTMTDLATNERIAMNAFGAGNAMGVRDLLRTVVAKAEARNTPASGGDDPAPAAPDTPVQAPEEAPAAPAGDAAGDAPVQQ